MAATQIQTRSLSIEEVIRYQLTVRVGVPNPYYKAHQNPL